MNGNKVVKFFESIIEEIKYNYQCFSHLNGKIKENVYIDNDIAFLFKKQN